MLLPFSGERVRVGNVREEGEESGRVRPREECGESVGRVWGECGGKWGESEESVGGSGEKVGREWGESWESVGSVWGGCGEKVGRKWGESGEVWERVVEHACC
eukprot:106917-Rhodomonas_salina.2